MSQSAYEVLVATTLEELANDRGGLWESGKVESDRSIHIRYAGVPLGASMRCYWKVRVWDENGDVSRWSPPALWEMGLLRESDWKAKWIRLQPRNGTPAQPGTLPLPIFRKEFRVGKEIRRAVVHVCGLGFYELHLNGRKVGDRFFDPGWTNYRKTCLYSSYDVTAQVWQGENALGLMLGNGMYNVEGGRYIKFTGSHGPQKAILQLRVDYTDGTSSTIVTDETWRGAQGPITFSCIFGGEDYDARLERNGWLEPGYGDSEWLTATVCDGPGGRLVAQSAPPIKRMQVLKPVKVTEPSPGIRVYDLGQNISGVFGLEVRGEAGMAIRITPAELLNDDGLVNQSASGGPHNYTYTLKGEGVESWHPRFTYYGFRYLQVEGATPETVAAEGTPALIRLEGWFTRSSAERIGQFACSSELFNRIHELIDWAVGSNLQSVLTDCPHREKLGWLEVAHLMAPSIMFNYDVPQFYRKVAHDTTESQRPDGLVPDIAPEYVVFGGGFRDSPEWGSASVIVPWILYQWYGDRDILADCYGTMVRYVDYLGSKATDDIVSHGLGDWFDFLRGGGVGESKLTPKSLTATAIYYHDISIVAQTAELLERSEDAKKYSALAERVRAAFNRELFDAKTGQYATGSQTANAMPLVLQIVDKERRAEVFAHLVDEVSARDYITAGDVGFHYLLRALADGGRSDLIHRLNDRTDSPGYGFQLQQGATSLTEAWDGRTVVSHNHCMLGHLQGWLHQELAGIKRDPTALAFKKTIIQPQVVGDITWAKASYRSMYGKIVSDWRLQKGEIVLNVTIPANTTATVHVPTAAVSKVTESGRPAAQAEGLLFVGAERNAAAYRIGSGDYVFRAPWNVKKP